MQLQFPMSPILAHLGQHFAEIAPLRRAEAIPISITHATACPCLPGAACHGLTTDVVCIGKSRLRESLGESRPIWLPCCPKNGYFSDETASLSILHTYDNIFLFHENT